MSETRLFIVAPDSRLARAVRILDPERPLQTVRFRNMRTAAEKARNDRSTILVFQWSAGELAGNLESFWRIRPYYFSSRLFAYVPDLPQRTVFEGEEIRFALLEAGFTSVFSQLRELARLIPAWRRHGVCFSLDRSDGPPDTIPLPWNRGHAAKFL